MASVASEGTPAPVRRRSWQRLPVVHQLRQSVGLQRGMLIAGLLMTGIFVEAALLAHADPQQAADALVQLALDGGGRDNVTVVVIDTRGCPGHPDLDETLSDSQNGTT